MYTVLDKLKVNNTTANTWQALAGLEMHPELCS